MYIYIYISSGLTSSSTVEPQSLKAHLCKIFSSETGKHSKFSDTDFHTVQLKKKKTSTMTRSLQNDEQMQGHVCSVPLDCDSPEDHMHLRNHQNVDSHQANTWTRYEMKFPHALDNFFFGHVFYRCIVKNRELFNIDYIHGALCLPEIHLGFWCDLD